MKVLLNHSDFGMYNRKVVEVELDEVDDARLTEEIAGSTGKSYALYGEYITLTDTQADALGEAQYLLQIPVKNLLALHDLLDNLSKYNLERAILEKL